jgi:glutamyl-tRNA synthetase
MADILPAVKALRARLTSADWNRPALSAAIKEIITAHSLKMPKLAMPLRVMLTGTPHTPSIDAVLELIGREEVIRRIDSELAHYPG